MTDVVRVDAREATSIYQRCHGELVGYLERLLSDRGGAEDIAQEAGMKLIDAASADPMSLRSPRAFLFHVATNLARDQLRRRVRSERALGDMMHEESYAPSTDIVAAAREEISIVGAALADLPARPRQILLMSRVEGLSHAEIAGQLGIAAKTVENHVGRALALLARRLGRRE
jgi:RNA polymerase sigma factor (sigma-70 family)